MIEMSDMIINLLEDGSFEVWENVYDNVHTFILTAEEYQEFRF